MTCKGCNTNFCYDCGGKTPHPTGSTCVHAAAGEYGKGNINQMNTYNRTVPNNNQESNRHSGDGTNDHISMHNQPVPDHNQTRNGRVGGCITANILCCWCLKLSEYT